VCVVVLLAICTVEVEAVEAEPVLHLLRGLAPPGQRKFMLTNTAAAAAAAEAAVAVVSGLLPELLKAGVPCSTCAAICKL
jgi:hypothetical protein